MSHGDRKSSLWPLLVTVPVLAIAVFAAAFWFQAEPVAAGSAPSATTSAAVEPAATFPANSATLGAIPDSNLGSPVCQNNSTTQRDVTFTASGLSGAVQTVAVSFSASHSFIQDLEVTLIAPSAQQLLLFSATGTTSTVANACSNGNDLSSANTYTFVDTASANWWTTAGTTPIPTSTNRTVVTGIGGAPNPPPTTSLNTAFAAATANGTWTLRFRDRGAGDTGTVTAASLTITTGAAVSTQHVLDYNGDGRTDYTVVRNTGGGPTGQVSWFIKTAGAGTEFGRQWGIATDFFVDGNWDGDANNDVAVWRSGASGVAAFYVLRSSDSTALISVFGQSGDDPTVVEDYNNDGRTDFAVYRAGAASGDPSTWFWRSATTPAGPVNYVPWGQNGDFAAPGDYDGDGSADYVVQRNNGGGQARFWIRYASGSTDSVVFGTPTDVIVPGDYDGDGKTDIATVRGISGQINWFYEPSGTAGVTVVQTPFGLSASDFPAQGDYDGDGKTDIAIWRPNADPTQNYFLVLNSTAGAVTLQEWGQNGDYPVANYNTH